MQIKYHEKGAQNVKAMEKHFADTQIVKTEKPINV
jgi:hypothetical protein